MTEPAYYVNSTVTAKWKQFLCWHMHAIAWEESPKRMERRFEWLNNKKNNHGYRPVTSELKGAHFKAIPDRLLKDGSRTFLEDKYRYMVKPPPKAYRIYEAKEQNPDGSISRIVKQRTERLSPAETIRLFHVLKPFYLDDFLIAGGAGRRVVDRTKGRALERFRTFLQSKGAEEEQRSGLAACFA